MEGFHNSEKCENPDSLSSGAQRQWRGLGQRPCVERSAGHLRPFDYDLRVEIQMVSDDHKMASLEFDGGVLTGTSSQWTPDVYEGVRFVR